MYFPSLFVPRPIVRQARPVAVEDDPSNIPGRHPVLRALISGLVCSGLIIAPCGGIDPLPLPSAGSAVAGASVLPEKVARHPASTAARADTSPLEQGVPATFWSPLSGRNEVGSADFNQFWTPDFGSASGIRLMADEEDAPDAAEDATDPADSDGGSPAGSTVEGDTEEQLPDGAGPDADGPREPADEDGPWQPGIAPPSEDDLPEGAPADGAGATGGAPAEREILPVEQQFGEGVVEGEVYDQATLDPIPQAVVRVVGTGREDETDAEGRFRITGLPAGDYTVDAFKLNYSTATASANPRPGAVVTLRFGLKVKPSSGDDSEYVLEEVAVVGEYTESSQGDFNLDITESMSLSSGLSAEDFAKENVSDAGEALAKISGANVVGGKFAVVRGLADRYISTTFNGGQVSSAVSDRKAIELDLFPTSTIQAIDVAKTYRPSLLGDFGGAAIDIQSRFFPNEPIAFAKVKAKFNPDLPDNFLTVPGKKLGFLGTTSNHLNPLEYTRTDPNTGAVRLIVSPQAEALDTWSTLNLTRQSYPVISGPDDEYSYGIGFGDTFEVTDYLDLGFLASHSWKKGSDYNESEQSRAGGRSWYQEDYGKFTEWDLYFAASARLNEDHEIGAVFFRKHIGEHNVSVGTDVRDPDGRFGYGNPAIQNLQGTREYYGADAELLGGFNELEPLERDLRILQLNGRNQMGDRGPRVTWSFTQSDAKENRPNSTFQEYTTLDFDSPALDVAEEAGQAFIVDFAEQALGLPSGSLTYGEAEQAFIDNGAEDLLNLYKEQRFPVRDPSLGRIDTLAVAGYAGAAGPGNILTRAIQSVEESTTDSNIHFTLPHYFSEEDEDDGFELGIGASRIERERKNRGSLYELVYEDLSASGERQRGFELDDFYPGNDADGDGISNLSEALFGDTFGVNPYFTGSSQTGPFYQDGSIGTDNFLGLIANNADSTHDFDGMFVSGNLFFGDTFVRGGLRYESEERQARFLEPKPVGEQDPAPIVEHDWLPSISVGTSVFDDRLNLVAAWSNTVARPTFYEWVPTRSFDLSTGFIRRGNPALNNSDITNYDLAAEFKATEHQTYRLSLFRKQIIDPIVEVRVPGVANAISFINGDEGTIGGLEFEAELSDIGPFSLKSNITYIDALLEYAFNSGEQVAVNFPYQPNWIVNLNLGYENEDWDFGANLVYNFTGEYATLLRTTPDAPDVVRESVHSLDLVLRKGFELDWGARLGVTMGIENLIATDQVFRFDDGSGNQGAVRGTLQSDRLYFAELKYDF